MLSHVYVSQWNADGCGAMKIYLRNFSVLFLL